MKYKILSMVLGLFLAFAAGGVQAGPWNFSMQLPASDSGIKIDRPIAMAVDEEVKRYYVVDTVGGTLVSFDRNGKHLAAFNAGGELKHPVAMAKGARGTLWVVERSTNQLLYVNPGEQWVRRFAPTYPDGGMIFPTGVATDARGRVLLLDRMRGTVVRLNDNLQVEKILAAGSGAKGFVDFKVKGTDIWALDGPAKKIYRFAENGTATVLPLAYSFEFPVSFAIDDAGQFHVLDRHAGTVAVFGPRGDFRYDFLGQGQRHGRLWYPSQVLFDWEGRLCVVDEGNGRVDVFSR